MSAAPVKPVAPSTPTPAAPPAAPAAPAAPSFAFADPPAKAGAPSTPGSNQSAPTKPDVITLAPWMGELDADSAAYVKGKGWLADGKVFADVVKAHRAAESFIGKPADSVMTKPDWSKPESIAEYRKAIGAPEAPDGYKSDGVKLPEGALDVAAIAEISHDLGLAQPQHEKLLARTHQAFEKAIVDHQKDLELRAASEIAEQEKGWGAAKAEKLQAVQAAITANGITAEDYDALCIAMGPARARNLLAGFTERYGEHRAPTEGGGGFTITTPDVARAEIARLNSDASFAADLDAGGARAQAARDRLNRLHAVAWSDA